MLSQLYLIRHKSSQELAWQINIFLQTHRDLPRIARFIGRSASDYAPLNWRPAFAVALSIESEHRANAEQADQNGQKNRTHL